MWEKHDKDWTYKYNVENKTITGNKSIEVPWEQEYESEIDAEIGNTTGTTKFKQSYYCHSYQNKQGEFKDSKYYDLLFKDEKNQYFVDLYWLSGRYVGLYKDYCWFGIHLVDAQGGRCLVHGLRTFTSDRFGQFS